MTKEIEKKLSKYNINYDGYNLVKYSYISEHCIYTTPHIVDILKTIVFLDLTKTYKNKIIQLETNLQNQQIINFLKITLIIIIVKLLFLTKIKILSYLLLFQKS